MIEAQTIERLIKMRGDGLPVLSLYVNQEIGLRRNLDSQLASLLDQVEPMAFDDSLEHDARLSLREDIERIRTGHSEERHLPGGVGIFSCSGRGLYERVRLPRPVRDRIVVDATPWLRPMLAMLDDYHRTCVVLIDRGVTKVWELYQDEMRETTDFRDPTLRTQDVAYGMVEDRVHHRADELAKRHYRRSVEMLDQMFRAQDFELLVIGGFDHEVPGFVESLTHELRGRVAGTFTVDRGQATIADIRASADEVVQRWERAEERREVSDVLALHAMGGLATVGLSDSLWAGSVDAVGSLLVQDGATRPGVVCDASGWYSLSGDQCPICGATPRETPDVIDELALGVIGSGGSVEHVVAETTLAEHLVAARLRLPLPPRP
jgi:peptide chain release factor subunit 1